MLYGRIINGEAIISEVYAVPFDYNFDVIVSGLGTAGAIAAISAAEYGLSVLGIDELPGIGGLGVYGGVWHYFYGSSGGRFEEITRETERMMDEEAYTRSEPVNDSCDYRCHNGTAKGLALEEAAYEAGCTLWYDTKVCGVYIDNSKIVGIQCIRESKLISIGAKVTIDSTGDTLLCRMAGLKLEAGRKSDGRQMFCSKPVLVLRNNIAYSIYDVIGFRENLNNMEFSQLLIKAGTKKPCNFDDSSEENRMIYEPVQPGIREAARIISEEQITLDGYFSGYRTSEPVFYAFSSLDNATIDMYNESSAMQDWMIACGMMYNYGISVGISLKTLIPRGLDGLLVAGKGIGIDHDLSTCIRMRKDMEKCGEAAAAGAYCAITDNVPLVNVDYTRLSGLLIKSGCLQKENDIGLARVYGGMGRSALPLIADPVELKKSLAGADSPIAIYSIWQNSRSIDYSDFLRVWMRSDDSALRENSAFAAALIGMNEAAPILHELALREPDIEGRHYAYDCATARAIYLLGRLKDKSAVEILKSVIKKYSESEKYTPIKKLAENALSAIES